MNCFILSRDLMFSSMVRGAASSAGLVSQDANLETLAASTQNAIAVLDLNASIDHESLASISQRPDATVHVIAIGPHVHREKLERAAAAGWTVLSRGQASRDLTRVLKQQAEGDE